MELIKPCKLRGLFILRGIEVLEEYKLPLRY